MADRTAETASKAIILGRIKRALGGTSSLETAQAEWNSIPREFRRAASHPREEILELLVDRLIDYDAQVLRTDEAGVAGAVQTMLAARGVHRLVVPQGMPEGVLPSGFDFVVDNGLSATELDEMDGVVTMAAVAIALTGTVVLQTTAGQGRRAATLVPDYHLCIVHAKDVVETVPEALERMEPTSALATTFVSGPSATADIEMTRIKGVHGPRFLDVVLVSDPAN